MISFPFQSVSIGVSWLPGSRRPYRFRSLIEARIYIGRGPSRSQGPVERQRNRRVTWDGSSPPRLPPCSPKVKSSEPREAVYSDSRRAWALRFFSRVSFAAREKDGEQFNCAVENNSDTTIIVAIHAAGSASIVNILLPTLCDGWHARRKSISVAQIFYNNLSPFAYTISRFFSYNRYVFISSKMETGSLKNNKDKKEYNN